MPLNPSIGRSIAWAVMSVTVLFTANAVSAINLVTYSMGTTGATSSDPNLTAGDLTNSSLSAFTITNLGYASAPVLQTSAGTGATDNVTTSFNNDKFFYFTLTPDAGKALDLDTLTFNVARGGASARNYGVRSNLTGTTDLGSGSVDTVRTTFSAVNIDLSIHPNLQNVQMPVTFQIATAAPSGSLEWDDIMVNGDVFTATTPPPVIPISLVEYNFDGETLSPTLTTPDLGASSISFGSLSTGFEAPYPTSPALRVNPPATNESQAVAGDDYFEFTITPTGGKLLNLDELVFDAARGGNSGPREWFLYSSIDGFTLGSAIDGEEVLTNRSTFTRFSVDLSDLRFQNLEAPITFRMYVTTTGTNSMEFDNIDVMGTFLAPAAVVVPEPATATLGLLAMGGMMLRRRRMA